MYDLPSQNPALVEYGRRIRNDQRGGKRGKLTAFLFLDHGFLPGISLNWEKGKVLFLNKISSNYIIGLDTFITILTGYCVT